MGRAIKELGETDLYIYAETDGDIEDYGNSDIIHKPHPISSD